MRLPWRTNRGNWRSLLASDLIMFRRRSNMPTLTETFELLKAERQAWRSVVGHGPQNAKLARYYEVRMIALGRLCCELMQFG